MKNMTQVHPGSNRQGQTSHSKRNGFTSTSNSCARNTGIFEKPFRENLSWTYELDLYHMTTINKKISPLFHPSDKHG